MKEIIQLVADAYGFNPSDILGNSRKQGVVLAREEACSLLDGMGLSLPEIGRRMKLDHTSVLVAIRRRHKALGYEPLISGRSPPPRREPQPWHVVGKYTRDKAWKIYRGPKWVAMQRGRTPLKAPDKATLEELLAKEYAK